MDELSQTQEPVQAQEQPTVQPTETGDKSFKQTELDAIIKQRLREQKTSHDSVIKAIQGDLDAANQLNDRYSQIIKSSIEKQLEGLPDSIKELVMKLDVSDQLEWLDKNVKKLTFKQGVPPIPEQTGDEKMPLIEKKRQMGNYSKSI